MPPPLARDTPPPVLATADDSDEREESEPGAPDSSDEREDEASSEPDAPAELTLDAAGRVAVRAGTMRVLKAPS